MSTPHKSGVKLVTAGLALVIVSVLVVVFAPGTTGEFPWGIHLVTIPGVCLLGVVIGWFMRDKQAAEDRARAEIERKP
ncbi:MAG: hypothetical protein KF754_06765 [Planctomycetes bacterium]|nr:hypothetical protein [Planctomycetota bacterium]